MAKGKKAKLANRKKVAEDMGTTTAPTMIDGAGHYVVSTLSFRTACGVLRLPWHFGSPDDVTCASCKETVLHG